MTAKKQKLSITIYEALEKELYKYAELNNQSVGKYVDHLLTKILPEYTDKKVFFTTPKHYTDTNNKNRFEQRISEENKQLIEKISKDNYMDKSTTFQIIIANYFAELEK